jgi:hypothetical protein
LLVARVGDGDGDGRGGGELFHWFVWRSCAFKPEPVGALTLIGSLRLCGLQAINVCRQFGFFDTPIAPDKNAIDGAVSQVAPDGFGIEGQTFGGVVHG